MKGRIPLILRASDKIVMPSESDGSTVLDDDLAAVLQRNASGYALARDTIITEINQETHDDK